LADAQRQIVAASMKLQSNIGSGSKSRCDTNEPSMSLFTACNDPESLDTKPAL